MKKLLAILIALPALAWASSGGGKAPLDHAPVNLHDRASLQRGAQIFVNHCLNCHSASAMRYTRLADIGLDEELVKENLLFAGDKVGETMTTAMNTAAAKAAFGVVPPDLSLIARSRSPDWIYSYMRSFYRDPHSKTGWNNTVFPNVAMPHVLWEYQGPQVLNVTERTDANTGDVRQTRKLAVEQPGTLKPVEYDQYVGDLVNYLVYMAEPAQVDRKKYGVLALVLLGIFLVLSLMLKSEYWKDVR
jgi:ubiquinol-cytochrome c reductase cytochrome c1 subunit